MITSERDKKLHIEQADLPGELLDDDFPEPEDPRYIRYVELLEDIRRGDFAYLKTPLLEANDE